jgi:hypothetical protein
MLTRGSDVITCSILARRQLPEEAQESQMEDYRKSRESNGPKFPKIHRITMETLVHILLISLDPIIKF